MRKFLIFSLAPIGKVFSFNLDATRFSGFIDYLLKSNQTLFYVYIAFSCALLVSFFVYSFLYKKSKIANNKTSTASFEKEIISETSNKTEEKVVSTINTSPVELSEIKKDFSSLYLDFTSNTRSFSKRLSSVEDKQQDFFMSFKDIRDSISLLRDEIANNSLTLKSISSIKTDSEKIRSEIFENIKSFEKFFYEKLASFENQKPDNSPEIEELKVSLSKLGNYVENIFNDLNSQDIALNSSVPLILKNTTSVSNMSKSIEVLDTFYKTVNLEINSVVNELIENNVDLSKKISDIHSRLGESEKTKKTA